jgi:hypothetical protein
MAKRDVMQCSTIKFIYILEEHPAHTSRVEEKNPTSKLGSMQQAQYADHGQMERQSPLYGDSTDRTAVYSVCNVLSRI